MPLPSTVHAAELGIREVLSFPQRADPHTVGRFGGKRTERAKNMSLYHCRKLYSKKKDSCRHVLGVSFITVGRGSVVGVASCCELGGTRIESR